MIAEKRKLFFFFSFKHRLATPQQAVHAACLNSQPSSIREQLDRALAWSCPGDFSTSWSIARNETIVSSDQASLTPSFGVLSSKLSLTA